MATKKKIHYLCQECGHTEPKWLGKCPNCGSWNSFTEFKEDIVSTKYQPPKVTEQVSLSELKQESVERISTGLSEFDQVIGGGLMRGSCLMIGGEPGIGKSTLMLQLAGKKNSTTLYISGEESALQIKNRASRINISQESIDLLCTNHLEDVLSLINKKTYDFVMIDSIQTLYSSEVGPNPGTVQQLKYCAFELIQRCKAKGITLFLIAHITKGGAIAGPKTLEHMVDTVLYFETSGSELRILRSTKNRFGSVDELGIFSMEQSGLKEIGNPESLFLPQREDIMPTGVSISAVYEGSRVFLVEIQALTVSAKGGLGRVYSDKIEQARINRIAAVLEKQLGINLNDQDIYVNVAGGIKLGETGIDLALAIAIYSAKTNITPPVNSVFAGEISLSGEVRPVSHMDRRKKAAENLGFNNFVGPDQNTKSLTLVDVFKKLFTK
ncbi:DNA repair protein RadA [Spirochaeta cellobiosiphila]|uniref:DNA repair protein RadA n=1 Tax=Spirochaeta cellobiosiphila TaxID=504483 RepID=UPI0003FC3889|nr:DNA repair protein RadA [Spirochaeta cellobiosiphila]